MEDRGVLRQPAHGLHGAALADAVLTVVYRLGPAMRRPAQLGQIPRPPHTPVARRRSAPGCRPHGPVAYQAFPSWIHRVAGASPLALPPSHVAPDRGPPGGPHACCAGCSTVQSILLIRDDDVTVSDRRTCWAQQSILLTGTVRTAEGSNVPCRARRRRLHAPTTWTAGPSNANCWSQQHGLRDPGTWTVLPRRSPFCVLMTSLSDSPSRYAQASNAS